MGTQDQGRSNVIGNLQDCHSEIDETNARVLELWREVGLLESALHGPHKVDQALPEKTHLSRHLKDTEDSVMIVECEILVDSNCCAQN